MAGFFADGKTPARAAQLAQADITTDEYARLGVNYDFRGDCT